MTPDSNDFNANTLQAALAPRPTRYYAQAGSTNDLALDWLREGAPAGAVVVADEQVSGRGRLGRAWHAPPGTALMLTVVLRPPVEGVGRVTMLGALAVCEVLESLGLRDLGIKWPNDVQLRGRKACGILPEAAWSGDQLLGVVLGIGLNVRTDFTGSPLEMTAASIEPALGQPVNRLDVLASLLERIDYWAARITTETLVDAWKRRLSMLGARVTVSAPGGNVVGTAERVDADGALFVRTDDGTVQRMIAGDIALGA